MLFSLRSSARSNDMAMSSIRTTLEMVLHFRFAKTGAAIKVNLRGLDVLSVQVLALLSLASR